ncbi:MAG: hypothetical protein ACI4EG_11775 [Fusicatenibacter sp.]
MLEHNLLLESVLNADILSQWKLFSAFAIVVLILIAASMIRIRLLRKQMHHPNAKSERSDNSKLRMYREGIALQVAGLVLLLAIHVAILVPKYKDLNGHCYISVYAVIADSAPYSKNGFAFNQRFIVQTESGQIVKLRLPLGKTGEDYEAYLPGTVTYGENSRIVLQVEQEEKHDKEP